VQDRIHEVAGAIPGERTTCAISAVSAGREAEDKDSSPGVTKTRDWASPIGLVLVSSTLGFSDFAAIGPQSGAALASDDGLVDLWEKMGRNLCVGRCHCIP